MTERVDYRQGGRFPVFAGRRTHVHACMLAAPVTPGPDPDARRPDIVDRADIGSKVTVGLPAVLLIVHVEAGPGHEDEDLSIALTAEVLEAIDKARGDLADVAIDGL